MSYKDSASTSSVFIVCGLLLAVILINHLANVLIH